MQEKSASEQIDDIITNAGGWKGRTLAGLRKVIRAADPDLIEEVKWKKPSKPEGSATWSHDGILCVADILKNAVRLTFPKGAKISDPNSLFNTRLDSKTVRAIDFTEDMAIDEADLQRLITEAVQVNTR